MPAVFTAVVVPHGVTFTLPTATGCSCAEKASTHRRVIAVGQTTDIECAPAGKLLYYLFDRSRESGGEGERLGADEG